MIKQLVRSWGSWLDLVTFTTQQRGTPSYFVTKFLSKMTLASARMSPGRDSAKDSVRIIKRGAHSWSLKPWLRGHQYGHLPAPGSPGLGWALLLTQPPRQLQEGQGASGGSVTVILLGYTITTCWDIL